MLKYELKKLFSKRLNTVFLILLLAAAVVFNLFAVKSVYYFDSSGTMKKSMGAVRSLTEEKNTWKGDLTPEALAKAASKNQRIYKRYGDFAPNDVYTEFLQPAEDVLNLLGQISGDNPNSVTPEKASNFYQLRGEKLEASAKKYGKNPKQQAFIREQYAKTDTPFYYEGADSWEIMVRYGEFYGIVISLVVGFFAAGIFSDEFRLQADSVFFAARHGRTKAARTKIQAGVLMTTILYWGFMLLFSIIGFSAMGTSGAGVPIQIKWDESLYNITFGQEYVITLLCGYIASLLSSAAAMLISAQRHSSGIAICVPFFLFCVSPFLARALGIEGFSNLIPQRLFFLDNIIRRPVLIQMGDGIFRQIPFVMVLYLAICLLCLPLIYRAYHRYTIK